MNSTNKSYNKLITLINQLNAGENINKEKECIDINNMINTHKDNNLLREFLLKINLIKYFNNMDSNCFDDVNILIEETKKGALIKE